MKRIITIIFWAFILNVQAQTIFNKVYSLGGRGYSYSIEVIDSSYFVVGKAPQIEFGGHNGIFILEIDWTGNIINKVIIGNDSMSHNLSSSSGAAALTNDKKYLLMTGWREMSAIAERNVFFVKTDLEGNVLIQKYYDKGSLGYGTQIKELTNGNYLIVGTVDSSSGNDIYLLWLDSLGNEIKDTLIDRADSHDRGYCLELTSDGGYVVSGYTKSRYTNDPNEKKGAYILKFDSSDRLEWETLVERTRDKDTSSQHVTVVVAPLEDGNYLIASTTGLVGDYYDVHVVKLSADGNSILENTTYDAPRHTVILALLPLDDGSIIFAGYNIKEDYSGYGGWIGKRESDGNMLWDKRGYMAAPPPPPETLASSLWDIEMALDGGFIATGVAYDTLAQEFWNVSPWMIKTDSLGNSCLYTGAQAGFTHTVNRQDTAIAFTNTSNEVCEVKWYFAKEAGMSCINSNPCGGLNEPPCAEKTTSQNCDSLIQSGLNKTSFTRYYPDTGTYEVTLIAYTTTDSDTLTKNIYIPPPSGVLSPSGEHTEEFSIYPNPAKSTITVIPNEAQRNKESVLILYDLLGNEIKRAEIKGETTIDIFDLPQGVYLYDIGGRKGKITVIK